VYSTFPFHTTVLGTQNNRAPRYDVESGTSMASPIVAAVAALAWSAEADATNETVRKKVEETAEKIGGTGTNWAHGRVNAYDAVKPPVP
jgi:thermitase